METRGQFVGVDSLLPLCWFRDCTQDLEFGSKHPYALSYLTWPIVFIFKISR